MKKLCICAKKIIANRFQGKKVIGSKTLLYLINIFLRN